MRLEVKRGQRYGLSSCVLVIGILLRFLYLDADPYYYEWVGYITDEGRWVQHARSLALHGTLFDHNLDMHFFLAPLFQLSNYAVFELAGVRLLTVRMFTALCGSAILIVFWRFLRDQVSPQALLLGVTLLAFQTDLVALSRVAVPEMVIMFFQIVIYFVIVSSGRSSWRMLLAGLLLLVACAMKATMALFLPIFSAIIFLMPRKSTETQRGRDLTLFWLGFTVPILVGGLVYYSLFSERVPNHLDVLKDVLLTIRRFWRPSSLYGVISFPFENTLSSTFNFWSLGLWLTVLGWLAGSRDKIDFQSHRYLATSATWLTLYLLVMLSPDYFPTRYKVHVLLPMAIFTTVGISLIQRLGMREVINSFGEAKGPLRLLWLAVLSFPTAAFLSPLLASAGALINIDSEQLRVKLACFILLLAAITYLAHRLRDNRQAVGFFLIFPLVEGMAWLILSAVNGHSFWPTFDFRIHAAWFSLGILGAIALSATLVKTADQLGSAEGSRFVTAVAVVYLTILLVRIAPGYVNRHYSIRDASRDLGRTVLSGSTISAVRAETLFNENRLRYTSFLRVNWPSEKPQILVIAFGFRQGENILKQEYRLMKSYNLYVSPEYPRLNPTVSHAPEGIVVRVYKSNGTG